MLKLLVRTIAPVEGTLDRAKLSPKGKYGLWQDLRIHPYLSYDTAEEVRLTGRIRTIYARDVTDPTRNRRVHAIAYEAERLGVPMRLWKWVVARGMTGGGGKSKGGDSYVAPHVPLMT